MRWMSDQRELDSPEKLITGLVARLRHHARRDSLLIFLPPLLVSIYLGTYLYRGAWITRTAFLLAIIATAGLLLAGVIFHSRLLMPSVRSAARLVDERADAHDRFITLATVEPSSCSPSLFGRVRREAAVFLNRIDLKREFPYKIKRSFYQSIAVSVFAGIVLHLFLLNVQSSIHPVPIPERIRELAEKMAQRQRLAELARDLQTLAAKLEDPKVSQRERQALVAGTQKKVEEQQKKEQQKDDHDLLGQTASTLKSLDQQSGSGQDQKDQDKGGGGIQSNLPQDGQGEAKQSQGSSGDNKSELNAQLRKEMQQGKSAQGDPKDQSNETSQQNQGDGKSKQADPTKSDGDKSKETAGKTEGKLGDTGGKNKASEEMPKGGPPAERFYQSGEQGKTGIKGERYVTVELPEEITADSKGKVSSVKGAKESKNRIKVPVSNVPLPAHVPDAPTETQQMPLEYRGMIR
jgi:hypothetical protein